MSGTLPLEIAPSLRLILVGDTGIGKSVSRTLFLDSVPGQVAPTDDPSIDISSLYLKDANPDDENDDTDKDDTAGQNGSGASAQTKKSAVQSEFWTKDTVSTLEIPAWLSTDASVANSKVQQDGGDDKGEDGEPMAMAPANNVVVMDFVGYGQFLDARQAIDRVETYLSEQYLTTKSLFGPSITPATAAIRSSNPSTGRSESLLEQLLVDSTLAHTLPDACLYFVLYDLKPVDILFMKRIMNDVNIIPVVAKADTMSRNDVWKAKDRILKQLQENNIEFFQFGFTVEELREMTAEKMAGGPPFALSIDPWSTRNQTGAQQPSSSGGEQAPNVVAAASLMELAEAINRGDYDDTHSDLSLMQALMLGSKNRILHQAAVAKFLRRWKIELGLPLEDSEVSTTDSASPPSGPPGPPSSQSPPNSRSSRQAPGSASEHGDSGASTQQQQQQPPQSQQQYSIQPAQQQQQPPLLQQSFYQQGSTYGHYMNKSAQSPTSSSASTASSAPTQEEDVQIIKLSRAQSVLRTASPAARIYTQGSIIPAVPPLSNTVTAIPSI